MENELVSLAVHCLQYQGAPECTHAKNELNRHLPGHVGSTSTPDTGRDIATPTTTGTLGGGHAHSPVPTPLAVGAAVTSPVAFGAALPSCR
jgi:hypothetical protein